MKQVRFGASMLAALLCALMFVSIAGVASASPPSHDLKVEATEHIGPVSIEVPQDPELLAALQELIPVDVSFLSDARYLCVDGMVHVNGKVSERGDMIEVNLHLVWHGVIALCDEDMEPIVTLDVNVLQLHLKVWVPASGDIDGLGDIDLKLNLKLNADLIIGSVTGGEEIDLSAHLLLNLQNGEVMKLKVWLPEILGVTLWES
jgi:hypothetical protein